MSQQKPTPEQAAELAQMIKESAARLNADITNAIGKGLHVQVNTLDFARFMAGKGQIVEINVSLPL